MIRFHHSKSIASFILSACLFTLGCFTGRAQVVPPIDLSEYSPAQFADDELDVPYYLKHFHRLANSVVMSGPRRGFINLSVWRSPDQQAPYNARVMENVVSLAYFYVTDRPWNPYFGHPAVRERLEAAIRFWINMQSADGLFSETGEGEWGISPTGFATKFIGETLHLLADGPPIDQELIDDLARADRRAIEAFLTSEEYFEHGTRYSNHYTTIWGGALAYLDLYPNEDLAALLAERMRSGLEVFQSPAGFFYERRGPDWVYEIETHHSNHLAAWHYLRNSDLADAYASAVEDWYHWLAYNAVLEPDTSGFVVNHSIETRLTFPFYEENRMTTFGRTCLPIAERLSLVRAFCESEEERTNRFGAMRDHLERTWPEVRPLGVREYYGYSPYAFLHRRHIQWHPTERQKAEARELLPYNRSDAFVHQRADDRSSLAVTYVRRPTYYAVFNAGEPTDAEQQFGLGVVWSTGVGSVMQSQKLDGMTWGTLAAESEEVYEAEVSQPSYEAVSVPGTAEAGARDIGPGALAIRYDLGERGRKEVRLQRDDIVVSVDHPGTFSEMIPLLVLPGDEAVVEGNVVRTSSGAALSFDNDASAIVHPTDRRIGRKRVEVVEIRAENELQYAMQFR